jgi:hypothetical protein
MRADGRIIQGRFHDTAADGRALACALGALGEDIGSRSAACRAGLMPGWLAEAFVKINDSTSDAARPGFLARLPAVMRMVGTLTDDDWTALGAQYTEIRAEADAKCDAIRDAYAEAVIAMFEGKTK